jgi:hypothetical protein
MFNKKFLKLISSLTITSLWVVYRLVYLRKTKKPWQSSYCVNDSILLELFDYTKIISQNPTMRNFILISNAAVLDCLFILFCIEFIAGRFTFKPVINFILFIAIKSLVIIFTTIEKYSINLFNQSPGIPSLLVAYDKSEQFIASYPGYAIIIGLAFWKRCRLISYIAYAHAIVLSATLMLLRANYSIDICIGLILAQYTSYLSDMLIVDEIRTHVPVDSSVVCTERSPRTEKNDTKIIFYDNIDN